MMTTLTMTTLLWKLAGHKHDWAVVKVYKLVFTLFSTEINNKKEVYWC